MSDVIILPHFKKSLKPLVKKFPSLKETVIEFLEDFDETKCIKIQDDLYKSRLKTTDLPKGQSKSFRMIIQTIKTKNVILPIRVYYKGARQNITQKEINKDLELILLELREFKL